MAAGLSRPSTRSHCNKRRGKPPEALAPHDLAKPGMPWFLELHRVDGRDKPGR